MSIEAGGPLPPASIRTIEPGETAPCEAVRPFSSSSPSSSTRTSTPSRSTPRADALDFGTLLFNITASSGGTVAAEYSAEGKLTVGMNGSCFDP